MFSSHSGCKAAGCIRKTVGPLAAVSKLLASLGHSGRRRVVLGHTLNTLWHVITTKSRHVLSKFTMLCWAAFTATWAACRPRAAGWTPLGLQGHTVHYMEGTPFHFGSLRCHPALIFLNWDKRCEKSLSSSGREGGGGRRNESSLVLVVLAKINILCVFINDHYM